MALAFVSQVLSSGNECFLNAYCVPGTMLLLHTGGRQEPLQQPCPEFQALPTSFTQLLI